MGYQINIGHAYFGILPSSTPRCHSLSTEQTHDWPNHEQYLDFWRALLSFPIIFLTLTTFDHHFLHMFTVFISWKERRSSRTRTIYNILSFVLKHFLPLLGLVYLKKSYFKACRTDSRLQHLVWIKPFLRYFLTDSTNITKFNILPKI